IMSDLSRRLRKYFIMGSQNCDRDPTEVLKEAINGGITAFQYREKGAGSLKGTEKVALGKQLRHICQQHHVLFFINDDVDLVDSLSAEVIDVGQDDVSVKDIRERYRDKVIGLSVSNSHEVEHSPLELVDYLVAGPVFATTTKGDARTPVSIEWVIN